MAGSDADAHPFAARLPRRRGPKRKHAASPIGRVMTESSDLRLTLRALIDAVDGPVFSVDASCRYTSFNASHAEIMKALYGAEIELGRSILGYQTVDADRSATHSNLDRALLGERVVEQAFSGEAALTRHYFTVTHDPIRDNGSIIGVAVQAIDMTARRRAEAALSENRTLLAAVIEGTSDAVYVKDTAGRYLLFNAAAERITGKRAAEVLGKDDRFLFPPDEAAVVMRGDRAVMDGAVPTTYEEAVTNASGQLATFLSTKGPVYDEGGELLGLFGIARDVTERRRAEEQLRESQTYLEATLDSTADGILAVDNCGRVLEANRRFAELWRIPDDLLKSGDDAVLLAFVMNQLTDPEAFLSKVQSLYGSDATDVDTLTFKDGRVFERHSSATMQDSIVTGRVWSFSDISEQVHARAELLERERVLSTLIGNLPGMAYRCAHDAQWTLEFASDGCEELTGYPPEALVGNAVLSFVDLLHPDDVADERRETEAAIARDEPWTTTYRITTASGDLIWVWERGSALKDENGAVLAIEGFVHEITSGHEAEVRLEAASAEWRRTFDAMRDSVAVFDRDGHLLRCNLATAKMTSRDFADIIGRPCYEVFHGTHEYHSDCPQLGAFASGRPETSIIEQDGSWLRVTFEPEIDEAGHVRGGVHVVTDVTDLKEGEEQLRASVARLEAVTEGVIAALSRSVEARDPYTSGHQLRVSELAAAIGRRLGCNEESVRRLQVASMLHDIGKIVVPAEILAKPGRLSEIEFELIKGHSQAAYDILMPIEFDFALADIVVQHHERLDGSGYPAGLAGDTILAEARILAVADVFEAMISHRPYRAALSIETAMTELDEGAGTRYDEDACEAAIWLFREQGFSFSE
jgi:PAS domain S-box-containing protein